MEKSFLAVSSCPALCRASTSYLRCSKKDVDGRVKPGHDEKRVGVRDGAKSVGVNARLLHDFDLDAVPVTVIDGKNLW
jgi:hypothetical protein